LKADSQTVNSELAGKVSQQTFDNEVNVLNNKLAAKPAATYGTAEPSSPATGDIWYDSNDDPATPKFYDGTEFVNFPSGAGDAVISSPAATGQYTDTGITYDYYTFTSSGTLTVDTAGFADVLVVGGGGGGGGGNNTNQSPGGGGAGGHLEITNAYLSATTHTVVVGAGGAVTQNSVNAPGNQGSFSRLGDYYGVGGGGGGSLVINSGNAGGSGGGGREQNTGAAGISGQGNDGGSSGVVDAGAGGGGAGAVGGNATSGTGGDGGAGTSTSLDNVATTRAGGGGGSGNPTGGSGGAGGGASGGNGNSSVGGNGTVNTGGGGGGGGQVGGAGGSGILIVRVKV